MNNTALRFGHSVNSRRFLNLILIFNFFCLSAIYLVSEYFDEIRISSYLSFSSLDGPGAVPRKCLPDPLGVHYFGDFVSMICHSQLPTPYNSGIGSNYFPFSYVIMSPFGILMKMNLLLAIIIFLLISTMLITVPIYRSMKGVHSSERVLAILISVIFTYPFISLVDRGNVQGFVTGFLVLGMYLYIQKDFNSAAVMISLACALKGYPVVFLLLFVQNRQWRALAQGIFVGVLTTIAPLIFFQGGFLNNTKGLLTQLSEFGVGGEIYLRYNNSLKGLFLSFQEINVPIISEITKPLIQHYTLVIATIAIVITVILTFFKIDLLEFSILASIFCCLLVDLTAGYVLTIFFVPVMVYLSGNYTISHQRALIYMTGIAILFAPKGLPIKVATYWPRSDYSPSFNSIINPLVELSLLFVIIFPELRRVVRMKRVKIA